MERITEFPCFHCDIDALAYWVETENGDHAVHLDCDECYHAYDAITVDDPSHSVVIKEVYEQLYDEEWDPQ